MAVFCTSSITAQTTLWRFAFIRTEETHRRGKVHSVPVANRTTPDRPPSSPSFRALHRP